MNSIGPVELVMAAIVCLGLAVVGVAVTSVLRPKKKRRRWWSGSGGGDDGGDG